MKEICSPTTDHSSSDPKLIEFHDSRIFPKEVVCVRDLPPMHGFGEAIRLGDKVNIHGTVYVPGIGFCISVPSQCAFYEYSYFEGTQG